MKKSKTPRQYLSWSSYSLFKRDREEWKRVYLYGQKGFTSEAMQFGTDFAKAYESGGETGNRDIDFALTFFPKYPKREHEIDVYFKGIRFKAKLDGCDLEKHIVGENKTGKSPWTQAKVDAFGQLTFYAMVYALKYKKIPKIELNWYDTSNKTIKMFSTKRGPVALWALHEDIKKVWSEIEKICLAEYEKII